MPTRSAADDKPDVSSSGAPSFPRSIVQRLRSVFSPSALCGSGDSFIALLYHSVHAYESCFQHHAKTAGSWQPNDGSTELKDEPHGYAGRKCRGNYGFLFSIAYCKSRATDETPIQAEERPSPDHESEKRKP